MKEDLSVSTKLKTRTASRSSAKRIDMMSTEPFEIVGNVESPDDVIGVVKRGLNFGVIENLRFELDISSATLLKIVGISDSTMRRRRAAGRLDQNESERVYRLGKLFHLATRVFNSRELAGQWFKIPSSALGGATPLDYADTEIGKQEIEKLLYRIAYGIVSWVSGFGASTILHSGVILSMVRARVWPVDAGTLKAYRWFTVPGVWRWPSWKYSSTLS